MQTKVVKSLAEHPLAIYSDEDVPVTISTDNRLFSRTSVSNELWRVHSECGISEKALRKMVLNAFEHSFLPFDEKQEMLAGVRSVLTENQVG